MMKNVQKNRSLQTIDLTYMALGAVLTAVCSWISIPATVPFTLQTFAVFLILLLLGAKRGTLSILVYILLGVIGLPVFSKFSSGMAALLGSTGGYIIGFLFIGIAYGILTHILGNKTWIKLVSMIFGLFLCYLFGTLWYMVVYAQIGSSITFLAALSWCVVPFVIPDLIKLALAFVLSQRLSSVLKIR